MYRHGISRFSFCRGSIHTLHTVLEPELKLTRVLNSGNLFYGYKNSLAERHQIILQDPLGGLQL